MQMREVMNSPCRQEFGERHRSKFRMHSVAGQVLRVQIQCRERSQILFTQASELVQELLERLALTLFYLRQAVKGVEGPRFAVLEDDACARHPVGALADDQMADDVERTPGIFSILSASFIATRRH